MQNSVLPRSWTTLATHAVLLALIGFLLMACGGGGGGDSSSVAGNRAGTGTFTVSGEITFAANTAIDSDVNDPQAPYASNDLYNDPLNPQNGINVDDLVQRVSRLVTIGGYVNQPGQGTDGRSFETGDVSDFFVADLTAGQTITLNTADSASNIDLFLYMDQDFVQPVALSTKAIGEVEFIQVNSPGTYFIEVRAVSGASNYTLNIATDAGGSQAASFTAENDFVPGDVIIKYKEAGGTAVSAGMVSAGMTSARLTHKAGDPGRAMLFGITAATSNIQARPRLSLTPESGPPLALDPDLRRKLETLTVIEELRNRPDVAYAEPNYIRRQQVSPRDDLYRRQWHYPLINLPKAWDTTTGDPGEIVAVVDTGVLFNHPDLSGQLTSTGYDFVSDPDRAMDGNGIDPDPSDAGAQNPGTSIFHGSHVAGTIAALTDNGIGVAGAGWSTRIMPVRALGKSGIGANYDIAQAVRYAAGLENDSNTIPVQKADIINLSLSGTIYSFLEQDVYDRVRAQGVIVVAAAGNGGTSQPMYPAAYDGVVAVGSVDINEQLVGYSNFGPYVDLVAPGGDLSVDLNGDGYNDGVLSTAASVDLTGQLNYVYSYLAGTSMAAAHASGVFALMKAVNPALTPEDLDELLDNGSITKDIGESGYDDFYGYGLIDAQKAVLAAPPAVLTVSPARLDFGAELSLANLTVGKIGPGPLAVLSTNDDVAWLSITKDPAAVDGDFPVQYSVQVDRTSLAPGDYEARITILSDNNTVEVPVTMQVAAPPTLLTVSPKSLDLGTTLTSADLTVGKDGSDLITVSSISVNRQWLYVVELIPGSGQAGDLPTTYRVQVDRTGLVPGEFAAVITFESENNTVKIPVSMQVTAPPATLLTVSPKSLDFGTTLASADLTVDKNGSDSITVKSLSIDQPWFDIVEIGPGSGQAGILPTAYRVQIDRTGLDPGEFVGVITFESENNTIEVSVSMQVVTPSTLLVVSPTSLDLGDTLTFADLSVNKNGSDPISVKSVSTDQPWLDAVELNPGSGLAGNLPTTYRVQIDRTGLDLGEYTGNITFESEKNLVNISVIMQVAVIVKPAEIYLGTMLSTADLTVLDGPGTLSDPYINVPWLIIEKINSGTAADEGFFSQYLVKADRTGLDPGEYNAIITFASDKNTVEIPIFMQVADIVDSAAGALYVQLKDPNSFETIDQKIVYPEGGIYRFRFDGVAAGRYRIFAGTNLDNDTLIGDDGEIIGAYLSLSEPVTLQLDRNLDGLDFGAGINQNLSAQ
jgi:serine protease